MSANLAGEIQPERSPQLGPGRPLSLVAAFPFDRVLAGMVAVGLGMEAICLYLGLSRGALHDSLIRLGLATPHDRPLRKPGRNGWSVPDITRLIAWRVADIHPETIAARLSTPQFPRSANAVRAKARRLGLRPPPRELLRRVDPSTLVDPVPGCGFHAPPTVTSSGHSDSATARCGTASGPFQTHSEWSSKGPARTGSKNKVSSHPIVVPAPQTALAYSPERVSAARANDHRAAGTVTGQGERQLPGVVQAPVPSQLPAETPVHALRDVRPTPTTKPPHTAPTSTPPLPLDLSQEFAPGQDLTWVGKCKRVAFDEQLVRLVSLRAFGGEHWKLTAKRLGFTEPALRTLRTRIDLPADLSRSRKGGEYDHERALFALAKAGWELYKDIDAGGRWFWRRKGSGQRRSLYTQRLRGLIDKDEARRFRPRISLAYPPCPA